MSDFDTRRVGEIATLEEKIQNLQAKLTEAQRNADKWTPVVTTQADPHAERLKVCLKFGGKLTTVQITYQTIQESDLTTLTTAVITKMLENLIVDVLRPEIEPLIASTKRNTATISAAGKW